MRLNIILDKKKCFNLLLAGFLDNFLHHHNSIAVCGWQAEKKFHSDMFINFVKPKRKKENFLYEKKKVTLSGRKKRKILLRTTKHFTHHGFSQWYSVGWFLNYILIQIGDILLTFLLFVGYHVDAPTYIVLKEKKTSIKMNRFLNLITRQGAKDSRDSFNCTNKHCFFTHLIPPDAFFFFRSQECTLRCARPWH